MVKSAQNKPNTITKKMPIFFISGILLTALLLGLVCFIKNTDKQAPVLVASPVEAPRNVCESPVLQKPPPPPAQSLEPSVPVLPEPVVEPKKRPIEEVIKDLRDDDISDNAYYAIRELRDRLPDDKEAMDALIEALRSDDRQQRIIAGCILAPYANHARLSRNRQFLVVMAEALNDRSSLYGMGLGYAAEFFLSGQGECATDLLQSAALVSQDKRQRAYAAFLLAVRMKIHPGNRLRVEEILSDPASDYYLSSEYRQGALAMVAMQAEDSESRYKAPTNLIPDHIYVVKKGDILSEIARIHGTEWWKLAVYNCLPDPNRIEPGQEIFIPGTLSVRTEKQKPGTEDNRPNVEEPKHQAQGSGTGAVYEHIIYPGETLEDVVRMYGVSRQDIVRLNSITDPSSVKPGTKLLVPIPE